MSQGCSHLYSSCFLEQSVALKAGSSWTYFLESLDLKIWNPSEAHLQRLQPVVPSNWIFESFVHQSLSAHLLDTTEFHKDWDRQTWPVEAWHLLLSLSIMRKLMRYQILPPEPNACGVWDTSAWPHALAPLYIRKTARSSWPAAESRHAYSHCLSLRCGRCSRCQGSHSPLHAKHVYTPLLQ